MDNPDRRELTSWVEKSTALLAPPPDWEPNANAACARFGARLRHRSAWKRYWLIGTAAASLVCAALLVNPSTRAFAQQCWGQCVAGFDSLVSPASVSAPGGSALRLGERAPDFELLSESGQTIRLSDFRGQFLVLNFWASWCPPCVEEIPSLVRFQDHFASRGLVVLGISVDENRSAYEQFLQKAGRHFLTARDAEGKIPRDYGTIKLPETYLIDARGKVVEKIVGAIDWMEPPVLAHVEGLLHNAPHTEMRR